MRRPSTQRGLSLIDALVALLILSLGMVALTGYQARVLAQGSDAQNRLLATRLADELLDLALIDPGANAVCYTLPAPATCPSAAALNAASQWLKHVNDSGLPLATGFSPTATLSPNGRLTVNLKWRGRIVAQGVGSEDHEITRSTDVR